MCYNSLEGEFYVDQSWNPTKSVILIINKYKFYTIYINLTQLGDDVSTTTKLFYIGVFGFIFAGIVQPLDETDRFFSSNIKDISSLEWVYHIGVSFAGLNCGINILIFQRVKYIFFLSSISIEVIKLHKLLFRNHWVLPWVQISSNNTSGNIWNFKVN